MSEVIYADVLVVLNIYVTYALLSLTGIVCRQKRRPLRLLLSSAVSGIYSLVILVPDLNEILLSVSRIPLALLVVYIAFSFSGKRAFLRLSFCFFAVSFAFAGVMLCLWLFFAPQGMYYNNGIVYFDIDTVTLVLLTVVCYILLNICHRFIKNKAPENTIYDCEIHYGENVALCHCFLDTGNSLTDPYTGNPVVIINKDKFTDLSYESAFQYGGVSFRLIPCTTVSGKKLLLSFKCKKIRVKGLSADFSREDVTIAVTEEKIRGGSFDGILPTTLFDNQTDEKGADFENETQRFTVRL